MNERRRFAWVLALAFVAGCAQATWASPYCCEGKSDLPLAEQFEEAKIVVFGHFKNAKLSPQGLDQGTTDLVIEHVYKDHPMIQGKKVIALPRYITDEKTKFLIFCDVYKGKIDAFKSRLQNIVSKCLRCQCTAQNPAVDSA